MKELSRRSQKKIQSIMENATDLFVKFGFRTVTMDRIASEAQVSKVTLYKYFEDKQALYEYIMEENYKLEFSSLREICEGESPFPQKMKLVMDLRMKKFHEKSIPLYKGDFPMSKNLQAFINDHREKMKGIRENLFRQGRDEGYISEEISDKTLMLYYMIIDRGLTHSLDSLSHAEKEDLQNLFSLLFTGIFHKI